MTRQQGTNFLKYVDLCVDAAHDSVKFHAGDCRLGQPGKPCARASSLCFLVGRTVAKRYVLVDQTIVRAYNWASFHRSGDFPSCKGPSIVFE